MYFLLDITWMKEIIFEIIEPLVIDEYVFNTITTTQERMGCCFHKFGERFQENC